MSFFFTVITSTFNCGISFQITADSIRGQQRDDIQWIIVDGASDQRSLDVIGESLDLIDVFISEPDSGIYNAWNKACPHIKGEWVIFLGAGDAFAFPDVLNRMYPILNNAYPNYSLVYGAIELISPTNGKSIKIIDKSWNLLRDRWRVCRPALPVHPETFQHKSLFADSVVFDEAFKIAGDADFLLRALRTGEPLYVPILVSRIVAGGVSQEPKGVFQVWMELRRVCKKNRIVVPRIVLIYSFFKMSAKYIFGLLVPKRFYYFIREMLSI